VPAQALTVQLNGQYVQVNIRQLSTGLFADVLLSNSPVAQGVVCEDRCRIVRAPYTGFVGDLAFADTQGSDNPSWPGLGTRFQLLYLESDAEVALSF
jgi:hypothetical protein